MPSRDDIPQWLQQGDITAADLIPWGSNYTFLATVRHEGAKYPAIYKPRRGEIPLWDFPHGTLYRREYAAYLLSRALGWSFIPATAIRKGPLGVGSLQQYVEHDPRANYFTLANERGLELRRIALFDCVTNNADRKAGHCLLGADDRVWAIDHGLTFHVEPKLRTVIWDFAGEPVPEPLLEALRSLPPMLDGTAFGSTLERLLSPAEVKALAKRAANQIARPLFPRPHSARSVPWPPV